MMENHNIVLAGVGGQGVLLLAEILGNAAILDNYDVRVSEIHGMAQRGGTVLCDVRMGEKVYSPTTPDGSADFLVGLEPVETLRHTKLINSETIIIVNKHIVPPASVLTGQNKYPSFDDITNILQKFTKNTIFIDAYELAKKQGMLMSKILYYWGYYLHLRHFL